VSLKDALSEPPASAPRVVPIVNGFAVTVSCPSPQTFIRIESLPPLEALAVEAQSILRGWDGLTPSVLLDDLGLPMGRAGREQLHRDVAKTGGVVPYVMRTGVMVWLYADDAAFRSIVLAALR